MLQQQKMHVEEYCPEVDLQNLLELAEWCEQFSPLVGIEEVDGQMHVSRPHPESLLLNVTNLQDLFGGENDLLQQVEEAFRQRGYLVRLAVADTAAVAWAGVCEAKP